MCDRIRFRYEDERLYRFLAEVRRSNLTFSGETTTI
jgi:hypothetical protein